MFNGTGLHVDNHFDILIKFFKHRHEAINGKA